MLEEETCTTLSKPGGFEMNKTSENRRLTKLQQIMVANLKKTEVHQDGVKDLLIETPDRTEVGLNSFLLQRDGALAGSEIKSSNH